MFLPMIKQHVKEIRVKHIKVEVTGKDGSIKEFTADDAHNEIIKLGLNDFIRIDL